MRGVQGPTRSPRTMFSLNTSEHINQFATGCDSDNGGLSSVHFDLDTRPEVIDTIGRTGAARFWGDMRLKVKPGLEGKVRGGWAGFRNKVREHPNQYSPLLFTSLNSHGPHSLVT